MWLQWQKLDRIILDSEGGCIDHCRTAADERLSLRPLRWGSGAELNSPFRALEELAGRRRNGLLLWVSIPEEPHLRRNPRPQRPVFGADDADHRSPNHPSTLCKSLFASAAVQSRENLDDIELIDIHSGVEHPGRSTS